jgi:hypothetical protein
MSTEVRKEYANTRLEELLSESASWDDLMREMYAHEAIHEGLEVDKKGQNKDVKETRKK